MGGQKLQKICEEHKLEFEIVILKFGPIFLSKSGEERKKGLHSNFVPFFSRNQVTSSPKPDAQLAKGGGGGGHASILLTFLCNFAILATQRGGPWPNGPLKYAPGNTCTAKRKR